MPREIAVPSSTGPIKGRNQHSQLQLSEPSSFPPFLCKHTLIWSELKLFFPPAYIEDRLGVCIGTGPDMAFVRMNHVYFSYTELGKYVLESGKTSFPSPSASTPIRQGGKHPSFAFPLQPAVTTSLSWHAHMRSLHRDGDQHGCTNKFCDVAFGTRGGRYKWPYMDGTLAFFSNNSWVNAAKL